MAHGEEDLKNSKEIKKPARMKMQFGASKTYFPEGHFIIQTAGNEIAS